MIADLGGRVGLDDRKAGVLGYLDRDAVFTRACPITIIDTELIVVGDRGILVLVLDGEFVGSRFDILSNCDRDVLLDGPRRHVPD